MKTKIMKVYRGKQPLIKYAVLVFPFIGLLFFSIGIYLIRNDIVAQGWDEVSAIVTLSKLHALGSAADFNRKYEARIEYVYNYKGREYIGNDRLSGSINKMAIMVNEYPVNGTVAVKVDPKEPEESRLKADIDPFSIAHVICAGFGAIFTIGGFILAYFIFFRELVEVKDAGVRGNSKDRQDVVVIVEKDDEDDE